VATVNHAFTHFRITQHAFECSYLAGTPQPKTYSCSRWIPFAALSDYALPKATHKVLKHVTPEA